MSQEKNDEENKEALDENKFSLELSDIIQIKSPTNDELDNEKFLIDYIDDEFIRLINVTTFNEKELHIDDDGLLTDESITEILLLNRSKEKGYARQNGLLPNVWVDIHFGGQIPHIITGKISNLDEDMIEVTTLPDNDVIFINFDYKGVPLDLPLKKIEIRDKPDLSEMGLEDTGILEESEEVEDESHIEFTNEGEYVVHIPENAVPEENIHKKLERIYATADDIVFGENLETIAQLVEIPENQRRYGINLQTNDILDTILSTIPNQQRTKQVMDNIHNLIERYKELRDMYSKFDDNGNIYGTTQKGFLYKPLTARIEKFDTKIRWLIPIVAQKRKIYDVKLPDEKNQDAILNNSQEILTEEIEAYENYKNNVVEGDENKYERFYRKLNRFMTPYEADVVDKENFLVNKQKIMTDLETIVGTLDEYFSSVYKDEFQRVRRYVIQKYNLGMAKRDIDHNEFSKKVYIRTNMTRNDTVSVKSLLMLPEPVVKYSQVDLPGTNILQRAHLSQNHLEMYRVLRQKTELSNLVVDNLSKEIDYEQLEKDTSIPFLSELKEFSLDPKLNLEENKFHKFLNVIIPQSRTIIHLFKKYINDKLSLVDICKELEPFLIYSNNLVYGQYNEIRFFIKERMKEHNEKLLEKEKYFSEWRNTDFNISQKANNIYRLFNEKQEIFDRIIDAYKLPKVEEDKKRYMSSSEVLFHGLQEDDCKYLYSLISVIMHTLVTPENILQAIMRGKIDDMSDIDRVKPNDCSRRVLAKKYKSLQDLQKDNNTDDVYFDQDYDESPYHILEKYEKEKKSMTPELFSEFMQEVLVQKHDALPEFAKDLAKTLVHGKKMVEDNVYALLEIYPNLKDNDDLTALTEKELKEIQMEAETKKKVQFYKRKHNVWVLDREMNEEFLADANETFLPFIETNTLFCNMSKVCKKNEKNIDKKCETLGQTNTRLHNEELKQMEKEFDKRYQISANQLLDILKEKLKFHLFMVQRQKILKYAQLTKYNNYYYYLGKAVNKDDVIQSPHVKLFDLILSQDDFAKKQKDIARFVDTFAREPMLDLEEDPYWLYCKETNVKLVPAFLYTLANTYVTGGNYVDKMDEICNEQGTISEDQDAYVDKHSGYVIRKIDYVTEQQYTEEGFKITSHMLMEKDLSTTITEILQKKKGARLFENELANTFYNIFTTICNNIDIPLEAVEDLSLRTAIELFEQNIWSKDKYEEESRKKQEKRGKSSPPYEKYRNRNIIIYAAAALQIAIQTAIPSFKTKKSFPNCVRSFSGYPLNGIEDMSTIKYMACVLQRSKTDIAPWNALVGIKEDGIQLLLKEIFESKIMSKRPDLMNLYAVKQEYIKLQPDEIPIEEQVAYKWVHFLPPIVDYSITNGLNHITESFKKELLDSIETGSKHQRTHISMLHSKTMLYGFAIIELIEKIVKRKDLLLKTASNSPFLENACCNDQYNNPIQYFANENENIKVYVRNAIDCDEFFRKNLMLLGKADLLYHNKSTRMSYSNNSTFNFDNEELIYSAFFHYLNFDNELPIPIDMIPIWGSSEKMDRYSDKWSLEEKIKFMKENGKRYTLTNLQQLMDIVYKRNTQYLPEIRLVSQINAITDLFESIHDNDIIEEPLVRHLQNVFNTFNPTVAYPVGQDRKEITSLKNYLQLSNQNMLKVIQDFLIKYGNNEYYAVELFIIEITQWSQDDVQKSCQFIQNLIFSMTKVFPSMIIHNTGDTYVPKHWGLSGFHNTDIRNFVDGYWKHLNKFKDSNERNIIQKVLHEAQIRFTDLNLFLKNIPIEEHITKDGEQFYSVYDKKTIEYLHTYCWYTVLHEYIMMAQNPEFLQINEYQRKKDMKNKIAEERDESVMLENEDNYLDQQEVFINLGDQLSLQKKICEVLIAFIKMGKEDKTSIDLPYDKIARHMRMDKIKEKNKITDYFASMDKDNRKVEVMMKQLKMGRWDVDVVNYNPDVYDREMLEMDEVVEENDEEIDDTNIPLDTDTYAARNVQPGREIIDDIFGEDSDNDDEIGFGFSRENYENGNYYEEDHDADDFGDDA
jgi:hypothetical protein